MICPKASMISNYLRPANWLSSLFLPTSPSLQVVVRTNFHLQTATAATASSQNLAGLFATKKCEAYASPTKCLVIRTCGKSMVIDRMPWIFWTGFPSRYENAPAESSAHVTHASAVQAPTWKPGRIWVPWVTLRP